MTSKKILLVAVNSKFTHLNPVPYYLRNEICDLGYNVVIKQYNINQDYFSILEEIVLERPEIVAFSVYIWNCNFIENLIMDLRNINKELKVIVGGPEASYNKKWLNLADIIVKGEGESAFKELAINNFKYETKVVEKKIISFNDIPFPYLKNDLDQLENKYVYYEASRGCPYKCSYCISSREDKQVKFKDSKKVFKELDFLLNSNCKVVKFVDRSFNCNRKFSREIWKYLIENYKQNVKFHFEIYPALFENEDFEILKNVHANYFQFEIGIQSVNLKSLKEINRNENPVVVRENVIKLMELKKIHIHLDLIAGLPLETIDDIKKSFNYIYNMKGDHLQLGFLKVLPGTKMEENKEKYEMVALSKPPYTVLKNKWISFEEIVILKKIEEFLEIFKNSNKFKNTINYLEEKFQSPFDLYFQLSKFAKLNENMQVNKALSFNFKLIYDFATNLEHIDNKILVDLLKIDWYEGGNFINVPDYLKSGNEGCRKLPEFIMEFLKNNITNCTQRAYVKLSSKELMKKMESCNYILFYRKEGKQIYKKYLKNQFLV